ncbi:hypothetical protein AA313_de0205033 [Arthrobotrys entomopaga]|nr:hypothetical protein AA313_de0205033 [Arthrobotrys entomopaga]
MTSMSPPITLDSRIKGGIFGVAVGDALGGPVEFQLRGTFGKVTEYQPNMNFGLPAGSWTDDTSMTLCLAQSFITTHTFSPVTQIQNYIAWYKTGYLSVIDCCFDIGNLTLSTLLYWKSTLNHNPSSTSTTTNQTTTTATTTISDEQLASFQLKLDEQYKSPRYCGNGSLMRTLPIGVWYYSSPEEDIIRYSHRASELTHPYPTNGEACAVYSILIAYILSSTTSTPTTAAATAAATTTATTATVTKEEVFTKFKEFKFEDETLKGRFEQYTSITDFKSKREEDISSSGYVVHSLEAALWAFFTTEGYEDGCVRVVNLGDDADTVGAIYGGLAGVYYGLEGIPERWREGLVRKEVVGRVAEEFYRAVVQKGGS